MHYTIDLNQSGIPEVMLQSTWNSNFVQDNEEMDDENIIQIIKPDFTV